MMASLARLLIGLLPPSTLKNRLFGWTGRSYAVATSARVQPIVIWKVDRLAVGPNCAVGFGTILRDLRACELGSGSAVGQFNWISGAGRVRRTSDEDLYGSLRLGADAAITSRHYMDCSGGISVGARSTVGGVRSTILSHGPDLRRSMVYGDPVIIGAECFVSSNVVILQGCTLADRVVVAAGSVVASDLTEPYVLHAGVPAKQGRATFKDAAYFSRAGVRIDPTNNPPIASA
jgi:acetyltransferase-like isoleucine patch superfamily enzyme